MPAGQLFLGEAIDGEWKAKAAAIETVAVPLERSDVRVTALSLVWIPIA